VPLEELQDHFGSKLAVSLWQQARGIASDRVGQAGPRKSISRETTFGEDVAHRPALEQALAGLAGEVAAIARRERVGGGVVTLKIRFAGFETHTRQRRLDPRTDDARVLAAEVLALLHRGGLPERPVRLIGVGLSDLGPPGAAQPDLFAAADDARGRRLGAALDGINARFGPGALRLGVPKRR
jgi:DNA polymerase-4